MENKLLDKLNNWIVKLNNDMVLKFGEPPKERGIMPSLKQLFDSYLFYNENKPEIKDFEDIITINMSMYIGERMQHIVESADIVYAIEPKNFFELLKKYIETSIVEDIPKLTKNEMDKRIQKKEIEKITNDINNINNNPKSKQTIRNLITNKHNEHNKGKEYCLICGDNNEETSLIMIVNSNESNKNLCIDCMNHQKSVFGVKFSKIKNNKSYMMNM